MNIREKENELFKRWREHSGADENTFFVQDGTLDPESYTKSQIKICSILKEVPFDKTAFKGYIFGDGFMDGLTSKGPSAYQKKKGTLSILAKRIALILNTIGKNQDLDEVNSLRESAYLNIKKYRGTKTSSPKDLKNVTISDKEFIREQIEEILKPEILLCGSTRHYLGFVYGNEIKFILEDESRKVKLFHLVVNGEPKRLIIEMYHPSHRSSEEEQLKKLESVLIEYRNSENFLFR